MPESSTTADILQAPLEHSTRVFLDELPWDVRSKNTDWRYVRFHLPSLATFEPSVQFVMQSSPWITLRENTKILARAFARRMRLPISPLQGLASTLSRRDLGQSGADFIFSHRAFPLNAGDTPVIWQNCVLDPAMQMSYGASKAEIEEEIALKGPLYRRAAAVQVSTNAEAKRMGQLFPDIADRFAAVPFFTPHVKACDAASLERHSDPGTIRLLFTGNRAWTKSLDLLLEAFGALPPTLRDRTELTIISNFVGPAVAIPQWRNITILRGVGSQRVLQEMARSHIFVNVSRSESYGLVFHEAMSQGLACLAPHWEVQKELFDNGKAGVLLPCEVEPIRAALESLISDADLRLELGRAAWKRFQEHYAPAVVARKYRQLFEHVAGTGDGGH